MSISTERLNDLARKTVENLMSDINTDPDLSLELTTLSLSSPTLNADYQRMLERLKEKRKVQRKALRT